MTLARNWRDILRHAWSVRLLVAAAILTALEAFLPFAGILPLPAWSSTALALATPVVVAAAFVSRFIAQKDLPDG